MRTVSISYSNVHLATVWLTERLNPSEYQLLHELTHILSTPSLTRYGYFARENVSTMSFFVEFLDTVDQEVIMEFQMRFG